MAADAVQRLRVPVLRHWRVRGEGFRSRPLQEPIRRVEDAAEMPIRVRESAVPSPGGPAGVQSQQAAGAFGGGANIRQPFPWFNCYCGDIDLIGQFKPQWLHRKVIWGLSKLDVAVQRPVPEGRNELVSCWGWSDELRSWTWPGADGRKIKVRVYSTGDNLQLLLNGKEIASKAVSAETQLKVEFELAYAPGELKAVAFLKNQQIAEVSIKTAGKPAKLRLVADRKYIQRKRTDLSYCDLGGAGP